VFWFEWKHEDEPFRGQLIKPVLFFELKINQNHPFYHFLKTKCEPADLLFLSILLTFSSSEGWKFSDLVTTTSSAMTISFREISGSG
jgi:hypothetical protein